MVHGRAGRVTAVRAAGSDLLGASPAVELLGQPSLRWRRAKVTRPAGCEELDFEVGELVRPGSQPGDGGGGLAARAVPGGADAAHLDHVAAQGPVFQVGEEVGYVSRGRAGSVWSHWRGTPSRSVRRTTQARGPRRCAGALPFDGEDVASCGHPAAAQRAVHGLGDLAVVDADGPASVVEDNGASSSWRRPGLGVLDEAARRQVAAGCSRSPAWAVADGAIKPSEVPAGCGSGPGSGPAGTGATGGRSFEHARSAAAAAV